jgi:hypothetical protein
VDNDSQGLTEDSRIKLVFDEALRAVTYQQGMLDNLRSRATLLTAASALIASLFGAPTIQSHHFGWWAAIAVFATAMVLFSTVWVCAPWYQWSFTTNTKALAGAVEIGFSIDDMRRNLAKDFETWVDENEKRLKSLQAWFIVGVIALFVEMLAWWIQMLESGVLKA